MSTAAEHSPPQAARTASAASARPDPAVTDPALADPAQAQRPLSSTPADCFMRRILRLPEERTATAAEARSAFQKSLVISATRCTFMYILFPFVLPAIGVAKGVGPYVGLAIGALAIVSITYSIRRFWRADHSKRWHYTIFGVVIICFLVYLAAVDLADIL